MPCYQEQMNTSRVATIAAGAVCLLFAAPAYAQLAAGGPGGGGPSAARPVTGKAKTPEQPEAPPALPGSRAEATAVAPATKAAGDMQPTEALFDAVNRGDLSAAKDALNRGADTNGRNVLGLTPLDLAIDLGRNEITFILLAMRGTDSGAQPPVATTPVAAAQSARRSPGRSREARASARPARLSATAAADAAAQAPRRFAGDGGRPNPQAGFLGFDSVR
jgi:hypothetical protein